MSVYSPHPQWKRGGRSEGGGSCDGCSTYRKTVRRRAPAAKVSALPPKRVEAVAIGSAAETETEEVVVEVAAATEELPVMPWATSVAR